MTKSRHFFLVVSMVSSLLATAGCDSGEDSTDESFIGSEGGNCYGNSSCDNGLICSGSDICVKPAESVDVQEDTGGCVTDCSPSECGDDGCGGSCGECPAGTVCDSGICKDCVPDCDGLECDDDGCGGTCAPGCGGSETCQNGQCSGSSCWHDCGDEVLIPAGTFWMGCNEAVDTDCYSDESPYHEVFLDAYYIDRTEVTVGAYGECVTAGDCIAPRTGSYCNWGQADKGSHPVNCVIWFQAEAYCTWAGKRLPTEAEWERAARGTDGRKYPWGNEKATCELAVMGGCEGDTQPVCSVSPAGDSPYGLCDMTGNVFEWTRDRYNTLYYSRSLGSNPNGPTSGLDRVFRGGSFGNDDGLRVSSRNHDDPSGDGDFDGLGFRCSRSE
jgi:Sulfatase-modifying factor enzyme 1